MKIGVIIGKFLPMHKGHIFFIEESAKQVDKLFVVVDEHPIRDRDICKETNFPYLDLDERYGLVKENLSHINNIEIEKMSEEGIREYPHGWGDWSVRVIETIGTIPDFIFTSDEGYIDNFIRYFPRTKPIIIDAHRKQFPISSTQIRKNIDSCRGYLPKNCINKICK